MRVVTANKGNLAIMNNNDANRPTIKDVAAHASVSVATVSRALSAKDYPISDGLRERVLNSAAELGYQPNATAQLLRRGNSHDIGLIIPNISNPFYLQAISGIDAVIAGKDQTLVLCNTENDVNKERKYLNRLYRRHSQGAIISSMDSEPDTINGYVKRGLKIVLLDQQIRGANCPMISSNMRSNGKLAVKHLCSLGHRNIAFATTPLSRWTRQEIYDGYREELLKEGIVPDECCLFVVDPPDVYYENDLEVNAGVMAANAFIERRCAATAILCINDMVAFGVISTLIQNGIRVPQDVSVMGFDDIPLASIYCPALTTVSYPAEQMGRLAAMMLIDSISSTKEFDPLGIQLLPQLISRQTTMAPKS